MKLRRGILEQIRLLRMRLCVQSSFLFGRTVVAFRAEVYKARGAIIMLGAELLRRKL
jgi:hypothetical protein